MVEEVTDFGAPKIRVRHLPIKAEAPCEGAITWFVLKTVDLVGVLVDLFDLRCQPGLNEVL